MADKTGYTGALDANGVPIPERFTDNGDGTYTRATASSGTARIGYIRALDANNAPIPIRFRDNGDGTYSRG
jgi:hypothetical protein